jgi:hypothetical protein
MPSYSGDKLGSAQSMQEPIQTPPRSQSDDIDGERVRLLRLRTDGERPLAVNLKETIVLTRKLFELREATRHPR